MNESSHETKKKAKGFPKCRENPDSRIVGISEGVFFERDGTPLVGDRCRRAEEGNVFTTVKYIAKRKGGPKSAGKRDC